jgi:hypothetical protein
MTLSYVYCLVRAARPRVPARLAPVPEGDRVRLLDAGGGLWLVVSHVPAHAYDEAALKRGLTDLDWVSRRAVAHEAVVERFLRARSVLPMQLFTLFTSDDRALAHVARQRARLERVLARVERQHEWGVRVTLGEQAPAERPAAPDGDETGAAYLLRKRDQAGGHRARLTAARTQANRLYRTLAREATAAHRRLDVERAAPASGLLVEAAFLVPATRTAAFRATLRRQARSVRRAGVGVSITGPWPPYHFVGHRRTGRQR